MVKNTVLIGVIIAILAVIGIGIKTTVQVSDTNNNSIMKYEYRDGKSQLEQNQQGTLEALQDQITKHIQNQIK